MPPHYESLDDRDLCASFVVEGRVECARAVSLIAAQPDVADEPGREPMPQRYTPVRERHVNRAP